MKRLNKREKILILLAVVTTLALGLPAIFQNDTARIVTGKGLSKAEIHTRQQRAERAVKEAEKAIAVQEPMVHTLGWSESPDALVPVLVQKLEKIAKASGVSLSRYQPVKPRSLDNLMEVSLEMRFSTSFPTAVKFLYNIQQPDTKVSVDVVRISSSDSESDNVDVDVRISAYSLQPPPQIQTAGANGRESRG
jgi:hypothetical protein